MATTFNPEDPMAGLPPQSVFEKGYKPTIENLLQKEEALSFIKTSFEDKLNEKDFQGAYDMARTDESVLGQVLSAGLAKLSRGYRSITWRDAGLLSQCSTYTL